MSKKSEKLRELLITDTQKPKVLLCYVSSVDETNASCDLAFEPDGEPLLKEVSLKSVIDNANGIIPTPEIGSKVLVERVLGGEYYTIIKFDKLSKLKYIGTGNSFIIDFEKEESYFNEGDNGGLIKISGLVDRLNKLENKVKSLISKYNSHVHPGVTTGGSSTASTSSIEAGRLKTTVRGDFENEKVRH
ncbi:MAG: hypothetical protein K9J21_06930 [Bacteroidales bacterium]|nr:hypothetical protein [Bacteroidales bacterium]